MPGAVAINLATFFGYNLAGIPGAIVAATGTALPSFVIVLIIAMGFSKFNNNQVVKNMFKGIRPAVVGLIIYAGLDLARHIDWSKFLLCTFLMTVVAIIIFNINPVSLILTAIVTGLLVYQRNTGRDDQEEAEATSFKIQES